MKQKILSSVLSVICFAVLITSCKKNDSKDNPSPDAQVAAHASDESFVSSEMDDITLDANAVVEYDSAISGNNSTLDQIICDASVAINKDTNPMTMTITYNGSNCGKGHGRTGKVILSIPKEQRWKNPGATVTVTFQDLKITRNSDNKSITINGSQTYTNVSGELLVHLANAQTITHTITSNDMSVSFDNGTARKWNIARKRVYTYNDGIVLTITGTHTEGDDTNIAEWGTNRFGNSFSTSITTPLVIRQNCDFRVTSGEIKHSSSVYSATATFGLDITGVVTTCPGSGHYYYKLVWAGPNGNSLNLILPY
jgi:hypothetical protein